MRCGLPARTSQNKQEKRSRMVIPTVRSLSVRNGPRVIRINPRDFSIDPSQGVGTAPNALEILTRFDDLLSMAL